MSQTKPAKDKMQDYVTVAERIEKFYERYPEGRIITHIVEHDPERGFILMRAEVYRNTDDAQPMASGHAYELKTEGYVQRTSYIEVCETSSVGRALAMAGFEVKRGIASREEMEKAGRAQAEQCGETGSQSQAQGVKMIAEAQLTAINNIGGNKHLDVVGLCLERYEVKPEALTFEQASNYIKWLGKQ